MSTELKAMDVYRLIKSGEIDKAIELFESNNSLFKQGTPFGAWLHVAATFGHLELVKWLIAKGVDINERGGTFNSNALNYAASQGHVEVIKYLLSQGSMMDVTASERNPLFGAIYGGHINAVQALLDAGIDFRVKYTGEYMKNMGAKEFAHERGQLAIKDLLIRYESLH